VRDHNKEANKMKSLCNNSMFNRYRNTRNNTFSSYTAAGFLSLLLSLSFFSMTVSFSQTAIATIDVDTSGDGRAAASDGEESIATDGDSFCSITDDIAGGKLSSLFEGVVDCDNESSQGPNQFLVEYSYTKNPIKIGEKTYLTITVKDKNTGNPISNAFVSLAIGPPSASFDANTISTTFAAATTSMQEVEKATQAMHTDNNGRATFTLQVGPKSDVGIYDTELEVRKDSYQSSFEQVDFYVIPQSEKVQTPLRSNDEDGTGGTGGSNLGLGGASNPSCSSDCTGDAGDANGDGGDGGDAVANGGTAVGGDGGAAIGGDGGDGGDAVGGNGGTAIGGDGGGGGDAVGGNAIGGDGGDGGDAVGVAQDKAICDGTAIGGAGGYGGDATKGIQGTDGENGSDEMMIC
jgi:hypothetical protein